MNKADKAVELKHSGYNCCQAVTVALADETAISEEVLSQIASGFCAGMGNGKATCGALIGANMIAGLKCEGKGPLLNARKISEAFEAKSKALVCRDLKKIIDGKPLCPCDDCVRNAVEAYLEVMGQ